MGKALIGGLVAGIFGAAVWVAIGYFLEAEVGYVAWGIGLIVGIGVAVGAETPGAGTGLLATAIAIGSVVAGKYFVVYFLMQSAMGEVADVSVDDDAVVNQLANEIVEERELTMPEFGDDVDFESIEDEDFYPPGVWAEAKTKFAELSPEQVAERKDQHRQMIEEITGQLTSAIRDSAFKESFGGFDILWFALAAITAFKVGAGATDD